jgi:hypothetical protein
MRNTRYEQMLSAVLPAPDIRHGASKLNRFVLWTPAWCVTNVVGSVAFGNDEEAAN